MKRTVIFITTALCCIGLTSRGLMSFLHWLLSLPAPVLAHVGESATPIKIWPQSAMDTRPFVRHSLR
jgi:hypothetical protein